MYASSSNSEGSSCFTIYSDKLLNAIVETFKAHKDHSRPKYFLTTNMSNSSEEHEVLWDESNYK